MCLMKWCGAVIISCIVTLSYGQSPSRVTCIAYPIQEKPDTKMPDTLSVEEYENGRLVKGSYSEKRAAGVIYQKKYVFDTDGKLKEGDVIVSKENEVPSLHVRSFYDKYARAVTKKIDLLGKGKAIVPKLTYDNSGRIIASLVDNRKEMISYSNGGRSIVYTRYDLAGNKITGIDSLVMNPAGNRVIYSVSATFPGNNADIFWQESEWTEKNEQISTKEMSIHLDSLQTSFILKAGKENMLQEVMKYYPQARVQQETYNTFDKKGLRERGIKRVYKEGGEETAYILKFVYE